MTSKAQPLSAENSTTVPFSMTPVPQVVQSPMTAGGIGAAPSSLVSSAFLPTNTPRPLTLLEQRYFAVLFPFQFQALVNTVPIDTAKIATNQLYKTALHRSLFDDSVPTRNVSDFALSLFEQTAYCTRRNPLWKTKICKSLLKQQPCRYTSCEWGHLGDVMRKMEFVRDQRFNSEYYRCTGFYLLTKDLAKQQVQFHQVSIQPSAVPFWLMPSDASSIKDDEKKGSN